MKKNYLIIIILFVLSIFLTHCGSASNPETNDEDISVKAGESFSYGDHEEDEGDSGGSHFFILPPMVKMPVFSGEFDGTLEPVVEIIDLSDDVLIAGFTMESGQDSIKVNTEEEHYQVNWHTKDYNLDPERLYRVHFFLDDRLLGTADLDVIASGKDLKTVDIGLYIGLKNGRTLPIKFRIEKMIPEIIVPFIEPSAGLTGTLFEIFDLQARIGANDVVLFYSGDVNTAPKVAAVILSIGADGKHLSGYVPEGASDGENFVSVRETEESEPRFQDLAFDVIPSE